MILESIITSRCCFSTDMTLSFPELPLKAPPSEFIEDRVKKLNFKSELLISLFIESKVSDR